MPSFLENINWVAVDTETTGLNPWKHEVIEIGAVVFNVHEIFDEFQILIKPENKQDPKAREIHKISNEELDEKGEELCFAIKGFYSFVKDLPLVFHNAPFDLSFLKRASESCHHSIPSNTYYDNLYLSRNYFPDRKSHALAAIKAELKIESGPSHRALEDAKTTAKVFSSILLNFEEELSSRKKLNGFLRYHRKMNQFQIQLPENLEEIHRYFNKYIQLKKYLKFDFFDRDTRQMVTKMVIPVEVMVLNQKVFIKVKATPTDEKTFLIPLKGAAMHDQELGKVKFQ